MTDGEVLMELLPTGSRVLQVGACDCGGVLAEVRAAREVEVIGPADIHGLTSTQTWHMIVLAGCRCIDCTVRDWVMSARHVAAGGYLVVLDTHPVAVGRPHQGHGPDLPAYGIGTRRALERMELLDGMHGRWKPVRDHHDHARQDGGVIVLQRRF